MNPPSPHRPETLKDRKSSPIYLVEAWFNAEEGVLQGRELSPAGGRFPEALVPISPPFLPKPLFLNITCLYCFR